MFAFGPVNAFVTKLNAAGNSLMYASLIGGGDLDSATGIALDASGNAFLSGFTLSTDFPTVNPVEGRSGEIDCADGFGAFRCSDAIAAQINTNGSALVFSTYLGGAGADDSAVGIAVDTAGNTYVAGVAGSSFPFTRGALQMSGGGFAAKISPAAGSQPTATSLGSSPNPSDPGQAVTLTATVTPAGPTGLVSIRDGNTVVGFASLNATGAASLSSSSLSGGSHSITAEYSGDANFAASTSAVLTQVVNTISLTTAQTSRTVSKGESTTFPLTVTQTGALRSAIAFSCSGLPAGWSCGFNPATVPAGSGPTQVMLTLQAGSGTAQYLPRTPLNGPGLPQHIWFSALVLLMLGIHFTVRRGTTVYPRPAVSLGFAALFLLAAGCGGGSDRTAQPSSPQPATVNFAVNATSGSATTSMPFTITVRTN